jgi:hypothetical protein
VPDRMSSGTSRQQHLGMWPTIINIGIPVVHDAEQLTLHRGITMNPTGAFSFVKG